ncbi:hypothetical protein GCM10009623_19360 [Nocardioides aestuarii]|uniref:LamG domain-containing protein n=1 Tax=Nocardioides aestuarii TaxID=252231 RepID=A0ABW4TMG4_9ACTN
MRRWTTLAVVVGLLLATGGASSADPALLETWTYAPLTQQLVVPDGGSPFSITGGRTSWTLLGAPAVRFSRAPSLAVQTSDTFVAPGSADFTYSAVMSVDEVRARSSANVFQYGRYGTQQIKLQLTATGKAQCVLRGTGGRVKVTSRAPSLDDGGRQHTFACWRSGGTVGVTLDSQTTAKAFALGSVVPTGRATAGNKSLTGDASDQLFGKIWSVSVSVG